MKNSLSKRDISILIGNAMDHFDTALYGFLAPILGDVFFANNDQTVRLILTYSILASVLVTRPIGSYLFGILGKKYGWTFALSHSLIGVAIATALIGTIPSYAQIGFLSPLLLIILRIFQGIYSEGECTIAQLYILENKLEIHAFKASYLYQASTVFGIILASFISTIVMNSGFKQYYWRACFIFAGITALIGYFLRRQPTYYYEPKIPLVKFDFLLDLKILWENKLKVLHICFVVGFSYMTYIIPFVFMNSFIPLITDISIETMMAYNTILLIFDMVMIPIIGSLTQKFHFKHVMSFAPTLMILTIMFLWIFLNNASIGYVNFVRICIIIIGVVFLCPLNCWLNSLFKGNDKYMLTGIGSTIGTSVIGRLTPSICLILWHLTHNSLSIALYIITISLLALWAVKALS
jgi:MFS family permease